MRLTFVAVVDLIAQDDLDAMKSSMKGMGDSFNSQLQKQVSEIVTTLNETKEKTEGQLSGLSTQMGGKADSMFLDDLECGPVLFEIGDSSLRTWRDETPSQDLNADWLSTESS